MMSLKIKTKQLDVNRRLEIYAVINFIAAYRRLFGGWPTLVDMPKPPEPDFIIKLDARELGVEVAHLYGSERDARLLLGHSRPEESTHQARVEHAMVDLNIRVPVELNRILSQKATKAYPRSTWLVIRNAYPLWKKADFEMYPETLTIPREHPFEQIWLLCDHQATSGMLRLFPLEGAVKVGAANGDGRIRH
jgi:hypothetical protein